jgi:short-subunit dehydrogenase
MSQQRPTVLITGASAGTGAVYADRFARRSHDLVLVARDAPRLHALASKLAPQMQVSTEILPADLTSRADLARVETRLREDERIGVLVHNAGVAARDTFANSDIDSIDKLIRLNVIAVTRLTHALVPRFLRQGDGAIVNVASIAAIVPSSLTARARRTWWRCRRRCKPRSARVASTCKSSYRSQRARSFGNVQDALRPRHRS